MDWERCQLTLSSPVVEEGFTQIDDQSQCHFWLRQPFWVAATGSLHPRLLHAFGHGYGCHGCGTLRLPTQQWVSSINSLHAPESSSLLAKMVASQDTSRSLWVQSCAMVTVRVNVLTSNLPHQVFKTDWWVNSSHFLFLLPLAAPGTTKINLLSFHSNFAIRATCFRTILSVLFVTNNSQSRSRGALD